MTVIACAIGPCSAVGWAQGAATPQEPSELSPPEPSCIEWTNLCRICTLVDGTAACSNVGIACEPQPLRCIRHREGNKEETKEEKKDEKKDEKK
jgi:hypothetical protein